MPVKNQIIEKVKILLQELEDIALDDRIEVINEIKMILGQHSPFSHEPVDCVVWVKSAQVQANDYNPNKVAHPELKLLEISIREDGFTQPIVTWENKGKYEIVDGFHRHLVGRESDSLKKRLGGYLPVVVINQKRHARSDRMAATIRHNRARGRHTVDVMAEIVVEMKERNRSNKWIAENLGMDEDEVLRLTQVSGLTSMFSKNEFSFAWEIETDSKDFETFMKRYQRRKE